MADSAEHLTALAQYIDGCEPDQAAEELDPILKNGRYSLLSRTIVEFQADQIEPVNGVLDAVNSAIAKVKNSRVRSTLGEEACKTVIGAISNPDFSPASHKHISLVADRGHSVIGFSESATERIGLLRDLSDATSSATAAGPQRETAASLFQQADTYLTEAAKESADVLACDRSRLLVYTASDALTNYRTAMFALQDRESDSETTELLEHLEQQPVNFYVQAISAANAAGENIPNDDYHPKILLVEDMIKSASTIAPVDTELSKKLVNMTIAEIDSLIDTYSEERPTGLSPAAKAVRLAKLGEVVATALTDKDLPYASSEPLTTTDLFVKRIFNLFKAAESHAGQTRADDEFDLLDFGGVSDRLVESVQKILFFDSDISIELLKTGYVIALQEDSTRQTATESRDRIISEMTNSADRLGPTQFSQSLRLYAIAHRYESNHLSQQGKSSSGRQQYIARSFLSGLSRRGKHEILPGNPLEPTFIEYAAQVAQSDNNKDTAIENLEALRRLTANDCETQSLVERYLEATRAYKARQEQPKSETARQLVELLNQ